MLIGYNVGVCLFGGFAPMIFEALGHSAHWLPALLLALSGLATALGILWGLALQARGRLRLTHAARDRRVRGFSSVFKGFSSLFRVFSWIFM